MYSNILLGKYEHEFGTTMFFDGNQGDSQAIGTFVEKTDVKLTMSEVHLSRKRPEVALSEDGKFKGSKSFKGSLIESTNQNTRMHEAFLKLANSQFSLGYLNNANQNLFV